MPVVPDNLMNRLHQANEAFAKARQQAEGQLDRMDMAQRATMAASLRAAEKECEDATLEIDLFLAAEEKKLKDGGTTHA